MRNAGLEETQAGIMLLSHIVIIQPKGFQIICGVAQGQTTPEVTCCQGQTTPEVACWQFFRIEFSVQNDFFRKLSSTEEGQNIVNCYGRSPGVQEFGTEAKFKTFSSTKEQDFWGDAISHGRKFLLSVLLYRKIRRMSSARQEFFDQDNSAGTRV